MTRVTSSALKPFRLSGPRALLYAATDNAPAQLRRVAPFTTSTRPPPSSSPPSSAVKKPSTAQPPYSSYKRSATTSSPSSSDRPSAPKADSTTSTTTNTNNIGTRSPFAERQLNPVPQAPYTPPPGMGPLPGAPPPPSGDDAKNGIDWSSSFHGLSTIAFEPEVAAVLMSPIPFEDVEVKPDGIIYLPEIKYRRILNQAFGPGGWGMAPRGELGIGEKVVSREFALLVHGRFIAQARGECPFFGDDGIATACEGCKSNALMRCCKDLGIASELWDPRYIREFKKKYAQEIWAEHVATKRKRQIWVRKGDDPQYPFKKS